MNPPNQAVTIRPAGAAIIIDVRVVPRSRRAGIAGTRDGALLVRLASPPVDGAANAELVSVMASALGVPRRAVAIVAGARSKQKRVQVQGLTPARAAEALTQYTDGGGGPE